MRHRYPIVLLALLAAASPVMAIEQPRFQVVGRDGDIEFRQYEPYVVAETFVDGNFEDAGNEGFRRLFRFITGGNTAAAEISMTAPVSQEAAGSRIAMTAPVAQSAEGTGHWVSFVVPSSYTLSTVPRPADPRVRIREVPAQLVAVSRYAGTWRESRYRSEEQRLRAELGARGLAPAGEARLARYNPPFMPPFLRRNEILIPIQTYAAARAAAIEPAPLAPLVTD